MCNVNMGYKIILITLLAGIQFFFSFNGDFVFDDSEAILNNKDVSSGSWIDAFYHDFWGTSINSLASHKSYRPLTVLSFKLNYMFNKRVFSAVQFKITNTILHVLCCVVIWKTYLAILNKIKFCSNKECASNIAYMAALLFCTHPVHVEAVSGIVGRADLLAAISFFSSFLIYDKSMKSHSSYSYLIIAIFLAGLAMMFKENGVTVLGFCIIYELITNVKFVERSKPGILYKCLGNVKISLRSRLRLLCLVVSIVVILYSRWLVMGGVTPNFKSTDNPAAFATDVFTRVASYNYIYFINTLLLIWPQWLCYDWSMGCIPLIKEVTDYRIFCIILLYMFGSMSFLTVLSGKKGIKTKRLIILSLSLLIIPFLPASNVFYPVGFVIAERILYIPSAGYCLLVAVGFHKILQRRPFNISKKKMKLMYFLLILIYAIKSYRRSFEWQTEYKLFTSGLFVCPLNAKVHYNVAKVADAQDNVNWALQEYKEAIRLYPDYYQAMNNFANLLKNKKQYKEAECYLRKAISLKQDFPAAWMNLGIVFAGTKKFEESEKAYYNALKYRKNYPDCHFNLGNLYLELNNTNMATDHLLIAIKLNPQHSSAWTNLLALLDNTGQIERALKLVPQALKEVPNSPSAIFAVANVYGKVDEYNEAEKYFLKAIKLFNKHAMPIHYANLGVLYHRWKKYALAEKMYKKALEIEPSFNSARKNLETLKRLKLKKKY